MHRQDLCKAIAISAVSSDCSSAGRILTLNLTIIPLNPREVVEEHQRTSEKETSGIWQ